MTEAILQKITALPPKATPHIVAIDGRCAAGKTTLAKALAARLDCPVLHMDDFFLPPSLRTPARLAAAGENVHHERFLAEVLLPLSEGKTARYRPYDCHTDTLLPCVTVSPAPVILVEGSYACHPSLSPFYSLRIFLSVSPTIQLARIERRNGKECLARFGEHFIPMEELYFSTYDIQNQCDIKEQTDDLQEF